MTIHEDTGEEVVCPICDATEYWECGHLVASLDRSFCDCYGGALYDHYGDFSSMIEEALLPQMSEKSSPRFENADLEQIWEHANETFNPEDDYIDLDRYALQRLLISLLEETGACEPPGSLIVPGGPGMTSSMVLLFADEPENVVKETLIQLASKLRNGNGSASRGNDHR